MSGKGKSRWLAFHRNTPREPVLGFYARGFEQADAFCAELLGTEFFSTQFKLKSGWRDENPKSLFFTKDSVYGVRYLCKACSKDALGMGAFNHWPKCPYSRERRALLNAI